MRRRPVSSSVILRRSAVGRASKGDGPGRASFEARSPGCYPGSLAPQDDGLRFYPIHSRQLHHVGHLPDPLQAISDALPPERGVATLHAIPDFSAVRSALLPSMVMAVRRAAMLTSRTSPPTSTLTKRPPRSISVSFPVSSSSPLSWLSFSLASLPGPPE